jgi:hypothetical protein
LNKIASYPNIFLNKAENSLPSCIEPLQVPWKLSPLALFLLRPWKKVIWLAMN